MNAIVLPWVARLMDERMPLPLVVDALIADTAKNWSPANPLTDLDWAALRKLDYDGEFDRLSEWIHGVFTKNPPGADVNGLFFGLIHPQAGVPSTVAIFVTGSKTYGLDPDWALNPDDCLPDNCVSDSPLLTEAYRIFLCCGDEAAGREAAVAFDDQFACLVVAEWACGWMRHKLLGHAPSRALYVGRDPWQGITVGTLRPERLGGFGSLMVTWKGRCGRTEQAGWITATRQAANWHHERWNHLDANVSQGWGALAWLRGRSAPERPVVRWFEEEVERSIVVLDDLFAERGEFATEALRHRLPPEPVDPEKPDLWVFLFLTWLRYFHAPGLVIRPEDEAARADWLIPMFRDLEQRHGAERAEEISLQRMKLAFAVEADRCQAKFAGED